MTPQIDEHQDATEAMAAEFSAVLKTWLSPEEMQEVVCRNEGEHDPTICHSHDFCDANMATHEVLMSHGMVVTDEGGVDRLVRNGVRSGSSRGGSASGHEGDAPTSDAFGIRSCRCCCC